MKDQTISTFRPSPPASEEAEQVSLCEALDRILHKGAVVFGEVTVSVADIDLLYLGLQVILASLETAREFRVPPDAARGFDYEPQ